MLEIQQTPLKDCLLLKPSVFEDKRGSFYESYNKEQFEKATGLQIDFVQDNQSTSSRGVLRGFHFQTAEYAQAKLVRSVFGKVLDVVVDLRPGSPTYKMNYKVVLSAENNYQLFVPAGFAHAFLTLSESSVFAYKCDKYYNREAEGGIIWNDPTLNINWDFPREEIILSEKDAGLPTFKERFA